MDEKLFKHLRSCLNKNTGGDHFSPSQIGAYTNFSKWCVEYLCMTQKERRQEKKRYKLGFGSLVGNTAQELVSKYKFEGKKKIKIKEQTLDEAFKKEQSKYLEEAFDKRDRDIREQLEENAKQQIENTLKVHKEIFGHQPTISERTVCTTPEGLFVDIIGRLDFESALAFLELKTKPAEVRWFTPKDKNKSSEWRFYSQSLPVDPSKNIDQVAFYYEACGKQPFIAYVNEKDYIIFDNTHEMMQPDYLKDCYQKLLRKAFTIQKLMILSNGNPMEFAKLVEEPDLSHWMYNDLSEVKLSIIRELWRS